ncbi:sigma-70 family RNA polymerase sigma factor [Candidatus Amarobacter glycogenicus]|uniref:RNA polymerase sigma factor n=1 Tax=Candidatus Amarobacter glycogenicus TaxID=3140699 RepID=UPI002A109B33|nr:sigma-70 family RNA polymerase sigma factor [Dehalococcoidia bacterium]
MVVATRPASDDELVRRARAGDSTALGVLYSRYFDSVYDFLLRTLRDPAAAEDAAQDTFIKAARSLDTLASAERFKSWLFTIARRTALNQLRSDRAAMLFSGVPGCEEHQLEVVDEDRFGDPASAAEAAALGSVVWAAAAGLDPASYAVLDLHLRQGFDSPEIAEALGITRNHAAVKLNRVKETMRRSVTALYMLQSGRRHCPALDAELRVAGADRFTPAVRKGIERHAAGCASCREAQMKIVSPESVFSALAVVPLSSGIAAKVGLALGLTVAAGSAAGAGGSAATAGAGVAGAGVGSTPIAVAAGVAALVVGSALAALAILNPFAGETRPIGAVQASAAQELPPSPVSPTPTPPPVSLAEVAGVASSPPARLVAIPAPSSVVAPPASPIPPQATPQPTAEPLPTTPAAAPPPSESPTPAPPLPPPGVVRFVAPPAPPPPPQAPPSPPAIATTPLATPSPVPPTPTSTPAVATPTPAPASCLPEKAQASVCPVGRSDGPPGNSDSSGKNGKGNSGMPPGQQKK